MQGKEHVEYYEIPVTLSFTAENRDEALKTWADIATLLESRSPEAYELRDSVNGYPGKPQLRAMAFSDISTETHMWVEDEENGIGRVDESLDLNLDDDRNRVTYNAPKEVNA